MTFPRFTRPQESRCGIIFGNGVSRELGDHALVKGARSILVLRSRSAIGNGDALAGALAGLNTTFVDGTGKHVPSDLVTSTVELARDVDADLLISLGGGSAIGLGKAVSIELASAVAGLAHIAVTATYSGSEQTARYGVTSDGVKQVRDDPRACPKLAVYDPELTFSLPPHVTAESGLNALAHCIEVLLLDPADPECRLVANDGMQRIVRALPACVARPRDPEVRADMMLGAMQASRSVIMTQTALHHALCHVIGGKTAIAHGALNAAILPYVVEANAGAADAALRDIARGLNLPVDTNSARRIGDFLRGFNRSIGLPVSLKELGIAEEGLHEFARLAFAKPQARRNPAPLDRPEDIYRILQNAWTGKTIPRSAAS